MVGAAKEAGIAMTYNQVGGMFGLFFSDESKITGYNQVMASDAERFKKFFHGMLSAGVYLAPSAFESGFVSSAHSDADIEETLNTARKVFAEL